MTWRLRLDKQTQLCSYTYTRKSAKPSYIQPGFSVAFGSTGGSGSAGGRVPFAAGANVEFRRHELLGGFGGMPPPPRREIGKIGLSKMQFPAFPGLELGNRNYSRNYLFSFDCMHYLTE